MKFAQITDIVGIKRLYAELNPQLSKEEIQSFYLGMIEMEKLICKLNDLPCRFA